MKRFACLTLLLAFVALPVLAQDEKPKRSVIYFIGDGMGPDQVTLGRHGAHAQGKSYAFDRFKSVGMASTKSANMIVTDSAAAGTALACGAKTNNKVVGMGPQGENLQSVLEAAHEVGYMTGLATTTRITHATPACFAAHVPHRKGETQIAEQLVARGFPEVMIGGGLRYFPAERQSKLTAHGYTLVTEPAALAGATANAGKDGRPRLAALIAKSHVPYKVDGGERVSIQAMTQKAVEVLSSTDAPFFLMVEGGRIDHACHAHDATGAIHEQIEFSDAINWALDRAAKDPNLLIVVTADHATGNLGISEKADIKGLLEAKASSEALVKGVKLATPEGKEELRKKVLDSHGYKLSDEQLARITAKAGSKYFAGTVLGHLNSEQFGLYYFNPELQEAELTHTHGHDGCHVPVFAFGPEAEWFQGTYENTEVPRKIAAILGLDAGIEAGSPLKAKSTSGAKRPSYFK